MKEILEFKVTFILRRLRKTGPRNLQVFFLIENLN